MIDVKRMKEDLLESDTTLYCSAMAHLRGKLHMTKLNGGTLYEVTGQDCWSYFGYNNTKCVVDARRHMFHWTMEDQAGLVESTINKYSIKEDSDVQEDALPVAKPVPSKKGWTSGQPNCLGKTGN